MDGGGWWAAVHGVAEGWTRLERLHFHFSLSCIGEGNGSPLQCSCLENPTDGGAWWAAVYGVTQSRTRLKWLSSSSVTGVFRGGGHLDRDMVHREGDEKTQEEDDQVPTRERGLEQILPSWSSEENNPADTLTLDFQSLSTVGFLVCVCVFCFKIINLFLAALDLPSR